MNKGCHNCKWAVGHYCERPGGNDCDWHKPLVGLGAATWTHWERRMQSPAQKLEQNVALLRDDMAALSAKITALLKGKLPNHHERNHT